MKKILLLSIAIVLSIAIHAKTIEKTFFYNGFQLEQQGEYYIIQASGALNTAITGEALLPWYAAKILLPPEEVIESVEFIGQDLVIMPGSYQLMPKQYAQPISKGESGFFAKNKEFYKSDKLYPENNISKGQTSFWAGHGIGFINYTPFVYQAKSGIISYYQQVSIIIHTKASENAVEAMSLLNSQESVKKQISSYIDNPETLDLYPETSSKNDNYEMMIITPDQFVPDFDTLVGHYLVRGMRAVVKSKEEILAEMSGQDAQEKIRNYIIQEYAAHGVNYVMLGGDVEHIPYRGFYCSVQSSSVYEDDDIPSDLYYSALDGNWNTDGDNKWGEIGEEDLLPEVAVARFSFSNSSELSKMLNKTISYQTTPVTGNLAHPLMVGEHLYDTPLTWGSQYLELLIGYHDDNGYETTGIPETNTFTKLYESNANWSSSQLMAEINSGKNFLHHVGHANTTYVMKFSNSDITNSNFSGANGIDQQFTNVYTHGCICGSFDANDCIAEHMVKIDNFAAAFVGNSRYGWFNEGQTEGPSAHIHREFIDALYTDSLHRIGATHMESKYATAPWVDAPGQHEEGALRWCFYDCNVLGDPAMSIWTAEPWDINVDYPSAVIIGANNFSVEITSDGNPVEGLQAALVMDGILYGAALSNSGGISSISLDPVFTEPGTAKLYISGFNCIPHVFDVQVIPAEGAYIILNNYEIDDANGNNNQMLDYGETVDLSISLENVGSELAEEVSAEISCEHPEITINITTADFGNIEGNSSETIEAAFNITASDAIEDLSQVVFTLNMNSEGDEWSSQFTIEALAPEFNMTDFQLNDEDGNNNGRLDPGETAQFTIGFINEGSSLSPEIQFVLSSTSNFINISNPNQNTAPLGADEAASLSFEISVDESAEIGDIAHLIANLSAGNYTGYMAYYLAIGLQVEDWEQGNFNQYEWYTEGDANWETSTVDPYEGAYCVISGNISDNQTSDLFINADVMASDSISFYYKVSSESGWDFLRFYIDENEIESWSGDVGWTRAAYPVTDGEHIFKWSYDKDGSVSGGSDNGCIDYIVFPAMGMPTTINSLQSSNLELNFFPNPVNHTAQLSFLNDKTQYVNIQIFDQNGRMILQTKNQILNKGNQDLKFNLSTLHAGAYTVVLKTKDAVSTIGFIKM